MPLAQRTDRLLRLTTSSLLWWVASSVDRPSRDRAGGGRTQLPAADESSRMHWPTESSRTEPRATEPCSAGMEALGHPFVGPQAPHGRRPIHGRGSSRGRARTSRRTTRTARRRARRPANWTSSSHRESWRGPCRYGRSTSRISGAPATTAAWRSGFRSEACARAHRLRGMRVRVASGALRSSNRT